MNTNSENNKDNKKDNNRDKKDDCSICMEPLIKDTITTNCNHNFHISCYNQIRTNRCPLCRHILSVIPHNCKKTGPTFDTNEDFQNYVLNNRVLTDVEDYFRRNNPMMFEIDIHELLNTAEEYDEENPFGDDYDYPDEDVYDNIFLQD